MKIHPILKSALTVGGLSGAAYGFMTQGENLEAQGVPLSQQVVGGLGTGLKDGLIGAGTTGTVAGTGLALAKILGK